MRVEVRATCARALTARLVQLWFQDGVQTRAEEMAQYAQTGFCNHRARCLRASWSGWSLLAYARGQLAPNSGKATRRSVCALQLYRSPATASRALRASAVR